MKIKLNLEKSNDFDESRDFTPEHWYEVITIEYGDYRVIPDRVGPYLYPKEMFDIVDPERPQNWIATYDIQNGKILEHAGPSELLEKGFFDRYFQNDHAAILTFNKYIEPLGLRIPRYISSDGKVIRNRKPNS